MESIRSDMQTVDFYRALMDSLFDAVYAVDVQGAITLWNRSCERLTHLTADEMIGQSWQAIPFGDRGPDEPPTPPDRRQLEFVLETGVPGTWKGWLQRKNGQWIPVESHLSAIRNDGEIVGAVEIFRDVSAQIALEQAHRELLQLSRQEPMTGLLNRHAISEVLKAEIARRQRYDQPLSVIMVDVDLFKRVNDRYGHEAGDRVLVKIADILRGNLRQPDSVGRWGGEEFLIVTPGSGHLAAVQAAERLRRAIEDVPIGEFPEPITASFGVAECQENQLIDQLLYAADMALYEAKSAGRNRVVTAVRIPIIPPPTGP